MKEVECPACGAISEGEDEAALVANAQAHTLEAHQYLVPREHVLERQLDV